MANGTPHPWPRLAVIEWVCAAVLLSHAGVFVVPPETFALSINFRLMQSIAPEGVWGGLFALIVALWVYAQLRRNLRLRQVAATTIGLALFWMGASFFFSNVNTTIGYTLIILGAGGLVGRVGLR
jgi:hypothetical protein